MHQHDILRPWAGALAAGCFCHALLLLGMQFSLLLWPLAVQRARRFERQRRLQAYLDSLSARYPVAGARRAGVVVTVL
jgi:hypothetical protein